MPKLGQAMTEGTVQQWHRKDGERVEQGQLLLTIETDKATFDIEAPASGIVHILVPEGQEVRIGTVIGEIGDAAPSTQTVPVQSAEAATLVTVKAPARSKKVLASPKAKQLAAERGIDLATVTASSADGVISAADVEKAIAANNAALLTPAVDAGVVLCANVVHSPVFVKPLPAAHKKGGKPFPTSCRWSMLMPQSYSQPAHS